MAKQARYAVIVVFYETLLSIRYPEQASLGGKDKEQSNQHASVRSELIICTFVM